MNEAAHLVPALGELNGQAAHNISQTTRLGPWRDLSCHETKIERIVGLELGRRAGLRCAASHSLLERSAVLPQRRRKR